MCELCQPSLASMSRRNLMAGGAALLAASALPFAFARADQPVSLTPPQNSMSPAEALDRLMQGNARYVAGETECKDFSIGRAERAGAQYPIVGVLSCSDSRVSPELLFEQGPGDIFVVRVAGNFVNQDGLASMEYAVKILGVPLLMVLGHTNCGAISAAVKVVTEHAELPGHLPELVASIEPAVISRSCETSERSRRRHHRGERAPQRQTADRRHSNPRRCACGEEDCDLGWRLRYCHRQGGFDLS